MCQSFSNVISYEIVACSRRSDSRAGEKNSRGKPKKKKTRGDQRGKGGENAFSRFRFPRPPPAPPVFPVYNLTRSPLTATLYYLNAWNRLTKQTIFFHLYSYVAQQKKNIEMLKTTVSRTRHFLARQEQRLWKTDVPFFNLCTIILKVLNVHFRRSFFVNSRERDKDKTNIHQQYVISTGCTLNTSQKVGTGFYARVLDVSEIEQVRFLLKCSSLKVQLRLVFFFPFYCCYASSLQFSSTTMT